MKLLGLDVGDRRVGVACGDTNVCIATPLDVVVRANFDTDVRALAVFVRKYEVEKLIIGLPRNMDGTEGDQAKSVADYAAKLANALNLPVQLWDERLSTVEATRRRNETGACGKKSRRSLDAVAAAVILQDYMDAQSHQNSILADSAENI